MNDPLLPKNPQQLSTIIAAAAVALLVISNLAWLLAYSALSQKVIGVDTSASPTPKPSVSASPTPEPTPPEATIQGHVGYPAGTAPAQTICAVRVDNASVKICGDHPAGNDLAYSLVVPSGTYYVYASLKAPQGDYTTSYKAYYNKYVTCTTSSPSGCASGLHGQYNPVTVAAGGTATGVDPTDWYALGLGQ